ncbi:MAG TPA: copper chaperone PCu(A)C [Anaerolineae bacterium]|nr:copper chaperone PCu(A)C [Anaerolineae bacterium]
MRQRITLAVISFLMLAWVLAACGSPAPAPAEPKEAAPAEPAAETSAETSAEPEITVMDPFARASIPNGAAYMTLMNQGGSDDALVSAETGVAQTVELHETTIDENEVMRMSPVEKIVVPAGGSVGLEPGGLHVMLLGIQEDLVVGDTFDLTLNFEKSGPQTIQVEVKEGMTMEHNMDHDMDHNMDHDMDNMEEDAPSDAPSNEEGMSDEEGPSPEVAQDHSDADHSHDAAAETGSQPQLMPVVLATYLLDNAGLHGKAERLNDSGEIQPEDAVVVSHLNRVMTRVEWPEGLQPQAEDLTAVLAGFAEALAGEEVEAATPLATEAHDLQHEFSEAVAALTGESDPELAGMAADSEIFQVGATQLLMDAAGFHGMDERLNDEKGEITPGDALLVLRVARTLNETAWPEALQPQAAELADLLNQYQQALADGDVAAAAPLAAEAHSLQHDFSAAISDWLSMAGDEMHPVEGGEHSHSG